MKKLSAWLTVFLLFVFLIENIGLYSFLMINRLHVTFENQSGSSCLETSEKIVIPLNRVDQNLLRIKRNEVLYKGKLYDILSEKVTSGFLILIAIHDKREEGIISAIKDYFSDSINSSAPVQKKLAVPDFLKDVNLLSISTSCFVPFEQHSLCLFRNQVFFISEFVGSIHKPPPQFC